jgi:hypothetical protein
LYFQALTSRTHASMEMASKTYLRNDKERWQLIGVNPFCVCA